MLNKLKDFKDFKLPPLIISKRDRNLLIILFITGICVAFWQFAAMPLANNLIDKRTELDALTQEVSAARLKAAGLEKNKAELEELKQEHIETAKKYFHIINPEDPSLYNQEDIIIAIARKIKAADITEGTVSYQQPIADETAIAPMTAADAGISFDFTGTYGAVMALLDEFENDPKNMRVETLNFSPQNSGGISDDITATVVVRIPMIYTPYMEAESRLDYDWNDIERGKVTPFDSAGIIDIQAQPPLELPEAAEEPETVPTPIPMPTAEPSQETDDADFFISTLADTADFDAATFGTTGDESRASYISSDKNAFIDVVLIFDTNASGAYFYRAELDGLSTGAQPFIPRGSNICLKIFSMPRQGAEDLSGIRLHVENKTNVELDIQIVNDDAEAPRVFFTYKDGDIKIK